MYFDNYDIISAAQDLPFPEIIAFLMERGINFRKLDGSVFTSNLSEAIRYDFVEYARWFIEHGADFNYCEPWGNGYFSTPPAQYARSDEMAEMLIAHGGAAPDIYQIVRNQKNWHDQLIERVEHINGYTFLISFRNGVEKTVNIEPYILKHPKIFQQMIDRPEIVKDVQLEPMGTGIYWDDIMGMEAQTLYRMGLYNE